MKSTKQEISQIIALGDFIVIDVEKEYEMVLEGIEQERLTSSSSIPVAKVKI